MAMAFNPPRRFPSYVRFAAITALIFSIIYYVRNTNPSYTTISSKYLPESLHWQDVEYIPEQPLIPAPDELHPIDTLISHAEENFEAQLKKETKDLKSTAEAYRLKRGRHPPPGFDAWFKFAQEHNAIIVEEFFDQIYHDLSPYWGLPAASLRRESRHDGMKISIRNGHSTNSTEWFWNVIWNDLTGSIAHLLPDMDIPINPMDEPRIVVPWEEIEKYTDIEKKARVIHPTSQVVESFQALPPPDQGDEDVQLREVKWESEGMCTEI